jgi:hypothetical protein
MDEIMGGKRGAGDADPTGASAQPKDYAPQVQS